MYSLVIKRAILIDRALLLEIIIPAPGLIKPNVDEPTAEADPTSISAIKNSIFFFLNSYTSFHNIHYQFLEISIYFRDRVFQFDILKF